MKNFKNTFEFRCPQCMKLYRAQKKDIHSSNPKFECVVCHAQFSINQPFASKNAVVTQSLKLPQISKLAKMSDERSQETRPELSVCPRCKTPNPRTFTECFKCGVVLAKAQTMIDELQTGGTPSLVNMWQELLFNYNENTKHLSFIESCEAASALPFALKKYQTLYEVQPQDPLARQMLNAVTIRMATLKAK